MEATHLPGSYDVEKSAERIDEILNAGSGNFSDSDTVPKRDKLTFSNGFYTNVTALFIDMVSSSDMTDVHTRPVLAKIYRSFLSETVAIMNGCEKCCEINIQGDCVWGVYDTPYQVNINMAFSVAARLHSLIKIINYKLTKKGYSTIAVGIGLDYGRALMVKAGYKGSEINDVIWMGDVVNNACHIANFAGREGYLPIVMSKVFYDNLNEDNKKLCSEFYKNWEPFYQSNAINILMDEWYNDNCG